MKRAKRPMKRKHRAKKGAAVAGVLALLVAMLAAVIGPHRTFEGKKGAAVAVALEKGLNMYMEFAQNYANLDEY